MRDREQAHDREREGNHANRVDELQHEIEALKRQLERLTNGDRQRVLIVATQDETIEVYADPQVRVHAVSIPETRTAEDRKDAVEWALGKLPGDVREMVWDAGIRPELFSVRCLSRVEWLYYRDRVAALGYLNQIEDAIEAIKIETNEQSTSETATSAPTGPPGVPW